jgi:hypothetical protein
MEDDELLGVRGEFEGLAEQVKLVPGRMVEPESSTSRHPMVVQAAGEVGSGDGGEFVGRVRFGAAASSDPIPAGCSRARRG